VSSARSPLGLGEDAGWQEQTSGESRGHQPSSQQLFFAGQMPKLPYFDVFEKTSQNVENIS